MKNMFKILFFLIIFLFSINNINAEENTMLLELKDGDVIIELYPDIAPNHVKRFKQLAAEKKYDGVVFHRVIDGFMAQTGDVKFGNSNSENFDLEKAGTGDSEYPNLKAEFSDTAHEKDSANSQFFICFEAAPHLDRQYTVFGKVIKGMEYVDLIKRGDGANGEVLDPDKIISLSLK